ncbi:MULTISPECIES: hypothetical protein [Actinomadura]|uniref:PH domain-containing protein n=2 Tax=Actinomadura yumaensis TaxID=111807 RepID=A0ABW2CFY3_9ACTN|nr:hypothetical protein [Actinomadura sp. J1-007]MWK38414.1 hypothetical protein [Actinomadura sp. J1-007]
MVDAEARVRCETSYAPMGVIGFALMWIFSMVGLATDRKPSDRGYAWSLLVLGGLLILTICVGLIRSHYVLRVIEFTRAQVRFESPARVRTVPIAEVSAVLVEHSGDTEKGYQETSLQVQWRHRRKRIVFEHDPALGPALVRLLPWQVPVHEQWLDLSEPDPT